jgi:peptidoglycan hydrolase-like protein with peptidoglycan-binding domain
MPARYHLISAAAFLLAVLAAGVAPALAQDRTEPAGTGVTGDGRPGGGDSEGSGGDSQGGDSGEPAALGATRGGAPAPTATTGDLPRERVRQVQERLAAAGFDPGPVDGVVGGRTRAALRAFQEARGLDPTGEPDRSTLAELGAE